MKIAILSCFHPYRGGIAQFNTSLYLELAKTHEVAAFNFRRQYPEFLFPGKTQYVEDGKEEPFRSERILDTANPLSYPAAAGRIRQWKPDLLVMRYWMPYFAPSLGYVARHAGKGCKVIAILDNVVPHERRFFDVPFTRYFLNGCDGFMTLCDSVRDDLLKFRPDAAYTVTPHPLYSNFGEPLPKDRAAGILGIDPARKTILFFGLIREYKGLDILIDAFSGLDDSYQLVIAGECYGPFEKYRRKIDASPLRGNILVFDRYIPDNEVATFFSASDVCVLPYRSATQSGINSIACNFGLPVITTGVGGLKETIGARGTGITVDDISPEAIREAVVRFFTEPGIREEITDNIKKERQRLSWSSFCNGLTELYNKL
ncbi:MAG TPA: glycosyltransferase [Candidatus Coprenecus stercoripullorum]|nr:glycosyltransferase [Candidatus Coprenecus stercoripullorum]